MRHRLMPCALDTGAIEVANYITLHSVSNIPHLHEGCDTGCALSTRSVLPKLFSVTDRQELTLSVTDRRT